MKNTSIKNKDKEKERLKKYEKAKKEAIANLTKTERNTKAFSKIT